jgi:hypothetical protein
MFVQYFNKQQKSSKTPSEATTNMRKQSSSSIQDYQFGGSGGRTHTEPGQDSDRVNDLELLMGFDSKEKEYINKFFAPMLKAAIKGVSILLI